MGATKIVVKEGNTCIWVVGSARLLLIKKKKCCAQATYLGNGLVEHRSLALVLVCHGIYNHTSAAVNYFAAFLVLFAIKISRRFVC